AGGGRRPGPRDRGCSAHEADRSTGRNSCPRPPPIAGGTRPAAIIAGAGNRRSPDRDTAARTNGHSRASHSDAPGGPTSASGAPHGRPAAWTDDGSGAHGTATAPHHHGINAYGVGRVPERRRGDRRRRARGWKSDQQVGGQQGSIEQRLTSHAIFL